MNRIQEFLLHDLLLDTNTVLNDGTPDKTIFAETLGDRFSITRFENGLAIIKINRDSMPLIHTFIGAYGGDLLSNNAVCELQQHFRLNSINNPIELIYGISEAGELISTSDTATSERIDWKTIQNLNPNHFTKYPFRNPNSDLIYFGKYINGEAVYWLAGTLEAPQLLN